MSRIVSMTALLFAILIWSGNNTYAKNEVIVSCSEADAEIFVNGQPMGRGTATVVIPKKGQVNVLIFKSGFLREEFTFFDKKDKPKPPKTLFVKMKPDDAFEASKQTDIANVNLDLSTSKEEDDVWLVINRIILSYFDVIETTDKETGYIRTAWTIQTFTQSTVRTRVIVKLASKDPLSYKFKIISEIAAGPNVSAKDDQLFKEWDRVLRKLEPLAEELPSRVL